MADLPSTLVPARSAANETKSGYWARMRRKCCGAIITDEASRARIFWPRIKELLLCLQADPPAAPATHD